jgi:hypothetical protein
MEGPRPREKTDPTHAGISRRELMIDGADVPLSHTLGDNGRHGQAVKTFPVCRTEAKDGIS